MKFITAIFFAFVAIVAYLGDVTANVATTSKEEAPLLKESSATIDEQQAIKDKALLEPETIIPIPLLGPRKPTKKPTGTRAPFVKHAPGQPQFWFGFRAPETDPPAPK